jgi:hypothetical protein
MRQVWPLDAGRYVPHPLHRAESAWPEANCSVDLWIEVLHAAGFEPLAALPCAFAIDLEGDQWTFFKLPFGDLDDLYGLEVFELNVWRPLIEHVDDQLAQRRLLIVEVDACYLPDTAGVTYHAAHVKTSIGIQMAATWGSASSTWRPGSSRCCVTWRCRSCAPSPRRSGPPPTSRSPTARRAWHWRWSSRRGPTTTSPTGSAPAIR